MDDKKMLGVGIDMIYLAASALRRVPPDIQRVNEMDLGAVSEMARFHSMQAIVYTAIADLKEGSGDAITDSAAEAKMLSDYGLAIRKLFNLEAERAALTRFLEENEVWYLPLKGIILKEYYPKLGMRQMTDNDILINPKHAKAVRDFFVGRGFEVYTYGKGCHDIYIKGEVTFEIHRTLASEAKKNRKHRAFCEEAVKRSLSVRGDSYKLELSEEDFYIYFIFHAYKHFSEAGVGIRTLMDAYVYLQKKRSELDLEYLEEKLGALELCDFERMLRKLAERLFSPDPSELYSVIDGLSAEERENLICFITSGTFGTDEQTVKNRLSDISNGGEITTRVKLKYFLRRIFPSFEYYKLAHPKLYKLIITIPFLWLLRLFRGIKKSDKVTKEIGSLRDMK